MPLVLQKRWRLTRRNQDRVLMMSVSYFRGHAQYSRGDGTSCAQVPWKIRQKTGDESGIKNAWIRFSLEWADYVAKCFTLSRWRSFTFNVASDGPHFFPLMSPRSNEHPLTSWGWNRTLTYDCIYAQRLHSRNVLALGRVPFVVGWLVD